ncbi:MAG: hypothetical protein Q8O99_05005 [bacterium]|nr:hypothetical protein [bacterium]
MTKVNKVPLVLVNVKVAVLPLMMLSSEADHPLVVRMKLQLT